MIEIRRATRADKQAIFEFLPKAYADMSRYKFPARWEWQFEDSPFRNGEELPVWLAVDEKGEVVGQICTMVEPLKLGSETHLLGWGVDAFLLPQCRGQGIGARLYEAALNDSSIYIGLRMTDGARRIQTALGCTPVDTVAVMSRVARFDSDYVFAASRCRLASGRMGRALLRLLHGLRLDWLVATLVNLTVGIQDLRLSFRASAEMEIKQIDEFDHTIDQFWSEVSPRYHAIVRRTSEYLNWKYVRQPHMNYQLFTAATRGRICGYVILRRTRPPESNSGIIADLLAPPDDTTTIHSLLAFAVRYFKHQNVNHISAASSVHTYEAALRALGFRRQKVWAPLLHSRVRTSAMQSTSGPGSWFFGRSDSDSDQFPYE